MFGKLQTPSPYHEAPPPSAGPAPGPPPLHPPPDLSEYLRSANGAADVQNQQMQPYIGPVPSSKPSSSPDGQVQLPEGSNDVDQAGAAWISSAFCFDQYHGEQQVSSDQQMYDANQYYSNQYHQPEQQSQLALPHQLQPFYDQYNASQYHEQYYNWFYAQPEYMQHAATAQQQHYPDYYGAAALVQYGYPSQSPASWAAPESATAPESLAVDMLDGAESFVIGPRGAHVNAMQAETGCRVHVQPSVDRRSRAQTASISGGDASARARCAALVQAKIAEFYDTQHEQRAPYAQGHAGRGAHNSESRNASASATEGAWRRRAEGERCESTRRVLAEQVDRLLGTGGAVITRIRDESRAAIEIGESDAAGGQPLANATSHQLMITGTKEQVTSAERLIDELFACPTGAAPLAFDACFKCGQQGHRARDCPSARRGEGEARPDGRAADWACARCHASVFASRTHCFRCQSARPASAGRAEAPSSQHAFKSERSGGVRATEDHGGVTAYDSRTRVLCHRCGKTGHIARECSQSSTRGREASKELKCMNCGERGHWARHCPNMARSAAGADAPCSKCGGVSHLARDCTASPAMDTDVDGDDANPSDEQEAEEELELERLRRENAELRRQSEVLCGVPPSKVEPSEASDAMTARDANAAITVDVANNAGTTGALCASHNGESVAASRYLSASGDAAQVHGGEPSLPELHETIAIERADLVDAAKSVVMDGVTVAPSQIKAARAQAHAQREQALGATQGAGASGVTTLPLAANSPDAVTHEDSHVALCVTDARVAPESNASPSAAHAHAQPVATTADQAAYPAASNSGVAADRASLAALPDVAHGATQPAAATLSSEANLMAGSRCRLSQPSSLRSGIPLSSSIHKLALKAATSAAKSAARSSAALMPGGVGQVASPGLLFAANQQVPYFTLDSPSFDSTAAPAYHLEHAAASVQ